MMKKHKIIFIILVLLAFSINAQSSTIANIPRESVYLQYNESLLFSGEHLKYKIYSIDNSKKRLTNLSKIGYVALLDTKGKEVFKHKIRLKDGSGYGDFFIASSIPTGSYKLIGYSEWMKNFEKEYFFQTDIHIINPYQTADSAYIEETLDTSILNSDSRAVANSNLQEIQSPLLSLVLNKGVFKKRDKVTLSITGKDASVLKGDYNLSIRKADVISSPEQETATSFYTKLLKTSNSVNNTKTSVSLPELRGEIVSGNIVNKDSKKPVAGVRVSLSLPGDMYLFNIATSNDEGKFRFILDKEYENLNGVVQVLADDWDTYEISMDAKKTEYSNFQYSDFVITKNMNDYILERSIQNQIENAYSVAKSDSIVPANHEKPFYRNLNISYDLDDYTRFNSIQETVLELIEHVAIRKSNDGNRVFEVRPEGGYSDSRLQPLVFVDGLYLKKHEDFMDYSAKKIKEINFSRDKVIVGTKIFQGIISFKTITGDFYKDFYTPHIVNIDLFKPEAQKEYYIQGYSNTLEQSRVPDYRYQLLWEPNLKFIENKEEITLYTSDITGEFEVVLEGFTEDGKPVSIKEKFIVE